MYNKGARFIKLSVLLAVLMVLMTLGLNQSMACEEEQPVEGQVYFNDVPSTHWAYDSITYMAEHKIIGGYPDGSFQPEQVISRVEFASMMVKALNLSGTVPEQPSFLDVPKGHWAYQTVERAKYYLTGFRTSQGDSFKPASQAVREDMAVALVKALKLETEEVGDEVLAVFRDQDKISPKLIIYVKIALKNKIMSGYPILDSSLKEFCPQDGLTRAEAAALLYNVLKLEEEKVTYGEQEDIEQEEEKIVFDSKPSYAVPASLEIPKMSLKTEGSKVVLKWQAINDSRLQGYKVVVSKNNSHPKYPEDGYLYWITNKNQTSAELQGNQSYHSGDFGGVLKSGAKYYISITAVYNDAKIPGNTIAATLP